MAKLTHRTNLLLTANDYQILSRLAEEKNETMAALIREAVRKVYQIKHKNQTAKTLKELKQLGQKAKTESIDYKKLINSGRKY